MKIIFATLVICLFLLSCSTQKESEAKNLNGQNVNIEAQISSLDAQIIHFNSMIDAARARMSMNQTDPASSNNAMIETEIAGYEVQKANVISQKNMLQTQLKK